MKKTTMKKIITKKMKKNKKNNCYTCVHITIIQLGRQGRVI